MKIPILIIDKKDEEYKNSLGIEIENEPVIVDLNVKEDINIEAYYINPENELTWYTKNDVFVSPWSKKLEDWFKIKLKTT